MHRCLVTNVAYENNQHNKSKGTITTFYIICPGTDYENIVCFYCVNLHLYTEINKQKYICTYSGEVVSTAGSQQEGPGFESQVRVLIGHSKLPLCGNVSVDGSWSLYVKPAMNSPQYAPP